MKVVKEMSLQNYQIKSEKIKEQYLHEKRKNPKKFQRKIDLSWSIWMFGIEPLEESVKRVKNAGVDYIEFNGDQHVPEMGLKADEVLSLQVKYDIKASGCIGLFSSANDLSSNDPYVQKRAVDYIKNQVEFTRKIGGQYMVIVPSAVGRTTPLDTAEFHRSVKALKLCENHFKNSGIKAAIEPIRADEVSLIHTVEEAKQYLDAVGSEYINSINGDIFHMLLSEKHIGEAVLNCGDRLVNLHLADSNRDALGRGVIDLDTVIMASYLVGMNQENRFLTFEPLGPNPNPYVLSNEKGNTQLLDSLVNDSVAYFREREAYVRNL
jgi:sugar phosphate isomerase/epimerase